MDDLDPYRPLPNPGETAMIEVRPGVAVIGAGISGLIAARILAERGYPVTVFDKGQRPGGRASTRIEGHFSFDHGCQYFTARDRRFIRYVEAWNELGIVCPWDARRASLHGGIISAVQDKVTRYVGVPGMDATARHLARDLDIRSGVKVSAVEYTASGWNIHFGNAMPETYEILVCAIPPAQTLELLKNQTPLVGKASEVSMQPCWAAMAVFDYELDTSFDAAHVSGSPLVWAANNGSKPGRSTGECWVLHASPSWSHDHIERPPAEIAAMLTAEFFKSSGLAPVKPKLLSAHRWLYASPAKPLPDTLLWDAGHAVGICGDWCHSARMEGAFLSGLELAEKIIDDRPRSAAI